MMFSSPLQIVLLSCNTLARLCDPSELGFQAGAGRDGL